MVPQLLLKFPLLSLLMEVLPLPSSPNKEFATRICFLLLEYPILFIIRCVLADGKAILLPHIDHKNQFSLHAPTRKAGHSPAMIIILHPFIMTACLRPPFIKNYLSEQSILKQPSLPQYVSCHVPRFIWLSY